MNSARLPVCLLLLRVTLFLVMGVWTIDKFVEPAHAVHVFEGFYGLAAWPLRWYLAWQPLKC